MAVYTIADMIKKIATTLSAAPSLVRTQYAGTVAPVSRLTEGISDHPLLQVYPEENSGTSAFSDTDRISLSGKHSLKDYLIYADLLAHPRANIAEDMARLIPTLDELEDILDTLTYPLFGAEYITSFRWSWRRVIFDYAGATYMGARFSIIIKAGSGG